MKAKILYVEDDPMLGFLTVDSLENHYQVQHAVDAESALVMFDELSFDLCILDVMLPGMDGFELATQIRKRNKTIPILFLSAKAMKEDRIKGLKIGADDYLVKPFSMEELQLKVEIFLRRSQLSPIENNIINFNSSCKQYIFDPSNFNIICGDESIKLTEKEAALLYLFYKNKNKVLKREDILRELWGNDDYFSGRSLDVFISRLRKIFKDQEEIRIDNIPRIGFKLVIP